MQNIPYINIHTRSNRRQSPLVKPKPKQKVKQNG